MRSYQRHPDLPTEDKQARSAKPAAMYVYVLTSTWHVFVFVARKTAAILLLARIFWTAQPTPVIGLSLDVFR